MQDTAIKGTGDSRTLKSVADFLSRYPTYEALVAGLVAGSVPIDIGALNAAGVQQAGTPLNKANLLSDATEQVIWGNAANRTVNDALSRIGTVAITDNVSVRQLQLGKETTFQKLITGRLI